MKPTLFLHPRKKLTGPAALLFSNLKDLPSGFLDSNELAYARERFRDKKRDSLQLQRLGNPLFLIKIEKGRVNPQKLEKWRKKGESLLSALQDLKARKFHLVETGVPSGALTALAEGMVLGSYQFLKYRKDADEKKSTLTTIEIISQKVKPAEIDRFNAFCEAVFLARDLVNEPLNCLNAEALSEAFIAMGKEAGFKTEVLTLKKIEALKMGGLLAVNRGSIDPPTFTIMEYKPEKPVNSKPIVLVGKGIVYDTGGLSLKPTSSMDTMKSDMAGSAAVAGAMYAIAKAGLTVHVVALAPATDNRPDGNAYVPGDIITMMDGTTVEVLNTDAEGRLILADALTFAKRYDPLLVIDIATLTGAAHAAVGKYGIVAVHSKAGTYMEKLKECSFEVHERIAEFPFWDDYAELMKSEIADLKNVGGPYAGAITAGKFLEHFTDYPWIHLDIAGPAYLDKKDSYRTAGGTGTGVRLFFEFVSRMAGKLDSGL